MLRSKYVAGCLALTLIASSTIVSAEQPRFSDMDNSYARESALFLAEQGIMKGISTDRFAPAEQISRKDFALVLAKAFGIQPIFPDQPSFADMGSAQPEYGYIEALLKLGLVTGEDETKFSGERNITRQDAAVILYRALADDSQQSSPVAYQDAGEVVAYAQKAVSFVTEEGLMVGQDGFFSPKKGLTRAETAVIAHRIVERGNLTGDYFWGVSPAEMEIKVGEQKQIEIMSQKGLLAYTPVFALDNPEIGFVSTDGIFTAVKPGKGLITVNVGHRHHALVVTVLE